MYLIELIANMSCALFAGAAIYINLAEHPARLECGTGLAATVFGPSYRRAAAMQASLALIATITGFAMGINGGSWCWFVGATLIFLVIPFTFIAIMPTNNQLLDPSRDRESSETLELLVKWGKLHSVRSVLSLAATLIYLYLSVTS